LVLEVFIHKDLLSFPVLSLMLLSFRYINYTENRTLIIKMERTARAMTTLGGCLSAKHIRHCRMTIGKKSLTGNSIWSAHVLVQSHLMGDQAKQDRHIQTSASIETSR